MSITIGVSPDEAGADAVALGAVLGRLLGEQLVLVHVHPSTIDYPSIGKVDAEWADFLAERSTSILETANLRLNAEWGSGAAEQLTVANSSVGRGLLEAAERTGGNLVVLGPGTIGREAHVSLGSTAHSIVHGGHVGVALAPEGYRETAPDEIRRLVVAFRADADNERVLAWSQDAARKHHFEVVLLSLVLRVTRIVGARLGRDPERGVMEALVEKQHQAQNEALDRMGGQATGTVLQGDTADQAMGRFGWRRDDLLVLGSSRFGALSRVFLGDTGLKIVRAATVPALLLPRE